ncbi:MAG: hypothetical protein ABL927_04080 [Bdellovibrionales bacterium]
MSSERENQTLRLVQFNVENLFLFLDKYANQNFKKVSESEWKSFSSSVVPNKSLKKCYALAEIIRETKPDILMLNEIGGFESLENFNKHFLNKEFTPYLKEGNSDRGIDVGYLVKKECPFKPILISHKDRPINFLYPHETLTPSGGKSHYFSRDVSEMRLFRQAAAGSSDDHQPWLTILLTHLKSKLDNNRIDFEGRMRRKAELDSLVEIYNEVLHELGPNSNIAVVGDFNGIARAEKPDLEFVSLHQKTNLIETLDYANVPNEKRFSQIQLSPSGANQYLQLDYIFVSPPLAPLILKEQTYIHHFKFEDRYQQASDHFPNVVTFQLPHS